MTNNDTPHTGPEPGRNYGPQPEESSGDKFFDSIRRSGFFRSEDRWVGGVAGGVARKLGVDPLFVRGLLAISLLVLGIGLVLYGIAWALLPEERDGRIHFQEMLRGNFDGALIGAGLAVIAGFSWSGATVFFPFSQFNGWFTGMLWLLATIGIIAGVAVAINQQQRNKEDRSTGDGSPVAAAYPTADTPYEPVPPAGGNQSPPPPNYPRPAPEPHTPSPAKVPGPGGTLIGSTFGIWALATAALLIADRAGQLGAPVAIISAATLIGLSGLGVIIAGIRGRTSGTLGTVAIITLVLALPMTTWTATELRIGEASVSGLGDATFAPPTSMEAEKGYAMIAGDWEIDLSELPTSTDPILIPVSLAAGDLTVRMPADGAWTADAGLAAGEIHVDIPGESTTRSGVLIRHQNISSQSVADGATPDYEVSIRGAAGQITIIEDAEEQS